jgi:hypothetical protein
MKSEIVTPFREYISDDLFRKTCVAKTPASSSTVTTISMGTEIENTPESTIPKTSGMSKRTKGNGAR